MQSIENTPRKPFLSLLRLNVDVLHEIFSTLLISLLESPSSSIYLFIRPAKLLADFVDRKMRGEKGMGDAEVDGVLDKV